MNVRQRLRCWHPYSVQRKPRQPASSSASGASDGRASRMQNAFMERFNAAEGWLRRGRTKGSRERPDRKQIRLLTGEKTGSRPCVRRLQSSLNQLSLGFQTRQYSHLYRPTPYRCYNPRIHVAGIWFLRNSNCCVRWFGWRHGTDILTRIVH